MESSQNILGGLFESCPLAEAVHDCPFTHIREMTPDEQIDLVKEMTNDQLEEIINLHIECIAKRTEKTGDVKIVRSKELVTIEPA